MDKKVYFLLLLCLVPVEMFCPYGCGCDEQQSVVTCIKANMEVMPISLNPGIRTLILKYNDFHVVDASFQFYPKLELVDLSHNSLVIVPSKAFKSQRNLLDLRLNDNKISNLPTDAFSGLVSLTSLEIRKNMLTNIQAQLFSNLGALQTLDLSYNQINQIEPTTWSYLPELRVLKLDENNLDMIPQGLESLTNLVELHMHRNKIINIQQADALILPSLSILDVRHNNIENIEDESLANLPNLKTLKLNGNKLSSVPTTALSKLVNLEILYLGQNNYFQVEENSLAGLVNLRKLDLSGCPALVNIQDNAFSENSNLLDVSITANKMLSMIGAATFSGNNLLERVDLSDNNLEIIPSSLLSWQRLKHFQVSGNPLDCGCENYFLKEVIHAMVNNSDAGIRVVRCYSPQQYRGQDLALIDLESCSAIISTSRLQDSDTLVTIIGVASVVSILCILTVLVLIARYRRSRYNSHTGLPPVKNILEYPDNLEQRYVVSNYPTIKTNIHNNPYHQATLSGNNNPYHQATLAKNGCLLSGSPVYQENVVLLPANVHQDRIMTLYPRNTTTTLLYKDNIATTSQAQQQQQQLDTTTTTTSSQNSDSGFSDYKSQASVHHTWARLQQDPASSRDSTDTGYSHIYADPIQTNQKVTTLLRFDPKSHYEEPLAMF